ncbi:acyl-CoA dehydrogenase family protein [Aeromicrobium sp. CF3.5]|uniref:acyl-CoA dehydrogenase family protein n=1 Tax=Aeromicrobium sp. CF3.5 TaxID=3373078 RepID=UPI003EE67BA4
MDTSERHALTEAVRTFAEKELEPHAVEWDETKHFPIDVLHGAGEMGLGGVCIAEDVGGSAFGRAESVRIFEQLARGDTSIAAYVSIHNMVCGMIDRHGTDEQRQRWLPTMTSMQDLGSYCLTEPGAGSDAAALSTSAKPDGDGWVLGGVKQFISGAGSSDVYVIMARTGDAGPQGITAFIVPSDAEGLSFGANERKMGWNAQPTRQVILEDLHVSADQVLGGEGGGFRVAMSALNGGRLNIAACSLGGAQWAVERAVEHLRTREAFGGPLLDRQGLQFRLADAQTQLEAGRCLLHRAADAVDAGDDDAVVLCAMAKKFVTDAGFEAANTALQMHGGYGYLSEYGIEKVVRDLRVHQILEGTNEIMQLIIARSFSTTSGGKSS